MQRRGKHVGIVNLILSDLHLDEVVNPDEIGGVKHQRVKLCWLRVCHFLLARSLYLRCAVPR